MSLSTDKDQISEGIFLALIYYVIYISQYFLSLCSSEKFWVPDSLEVHSIIVYATAVAEYKTLHFIHL